MNDEELIKELLADPTITFAEAERMAVAHVVYASKGIRLPYLSVQSELRNRGVKSLPREATGSLAS